MKINQEKIANNTAFMYLRLLVTLPLSFYTSRVVLQQLGVEDFGIYQTVAGIISMFAILRSAFDSATQRYYNVAMAEEKEDLLSRMFSASLIIQFVIALLLVVLIEIFGNWFIANKMQYPLHSEADVYFVFHTMVISVIFIVMNIPFSGMIIAKEHMNFYAYLSILDVLLKLGLVFMLFFLSKNKLKVYALFQMIVPLLLYILSIIYFRINFREIRIAKINKELIKEMTVFSGWGLLGNVCYSLVNEGVNLLLNVFGGVAANAARGIAFQVRGVISNILSTTVMPVRPQATQMFIKKETREFWNVIYTYSKILFLLASLMVVPIFVYAGEIIEIWLGMVPEYSIVFLQILMLYTLVRSFHEPLDIVFKASGRMKPYQIMTVCISSMTFFLGWFFLKWGYPIYAPFIIFCIIEGILLFALLMLARKEGNDLFMYFKSVLFPCSFYLLIGMMICIFMCRFISLWYWGVSFSVLTLLLLAYAIVLKKKERILIKSLVQKRFYR